MGMLFQLIKKDLLVHIRNKHVLVILLLMPVALTSILGFALSGFISEDFSSIKANIYVIEHGDEQEELKQFLKEVEKSSFLPKEAKMEISQVAGQMLPVSILKDKVLNSKGLKDSIRMKEQEADDLDKIKSNKDTSAIIEIPENFTLSFLRKMFFGKGNEPKIIFSANEGKDLSVGMLEGILKDFQEEYSFSNFVQKEQIPLRNVQEKEIKILKETVNEVPSINAISYYTIGMSTMFVMYVASNLASFALREKKLNLFQRITLSNMSPWMYLGSTFISGAILSYVQLCILYGVSTIFYGVKIPDIPVFMLINFLLSIGIGGFSSLLTAISFRTNKENIADGFSNIIVTLLAFLGGSMIPINTFSDWFQSLGSYTLNGAALKSYLKMMQGYDLIAFTPQIITMLSYSVLLLVISVLIFPRKGDA